MGERRREKGVVLSVVYENDYEEKVNEKFAFSWFFCYLCSEFEKNYTNNQFITTKTSKYEKTFYSFGSLAVHGNGCGGANADIIVYSG